MSLDFFFGQFPVARSHVIAMGEGNVDQVNCYKKKTLNTIKCKDREYCYDAACHSSSRINFLKKKYWIRFQQSVKIDQQIFSSPGHIMVFGIVRISATEHEIY